MSAEYPEHDKLKAVQQEVETIGSFIEWFICEQPNIERLDAVAVEKLVGKYFGIDPVKLEAEKQQMLEELQI